MEAACWRSIDRLRKFFRNLANVSAMMFHSTAQRSFISLETAMPTWITQTVPL
jgi:hypothetical protein